MGKTGILIVEDDLDILEFFQELLSSAGYSVATATGGEQAISLLERQRFDLLLIDLKMPKMSGLEVLKRAKKIDPDIIGILITGDLTFKVNLQELEYSGVYNWLFKPLEDINQLLFVVQRALEYRDCQQETKKLKNELRSLNQTLKQVQEQLSQKEKLASSEQVIKNIKQELGNSLSVIKSSVAFLNKKLAGSDKVVQKHLQQLGRQSVLCEKILSDLLDFSREKEPT